MEAIAVSSAEGIPAKAIKCPLRLMGL